MDNTAKGYIAGDSETQPNDFEGVVSPMLTVWRKLHIEVDRMQKWQGVKPAPDRTTATASSWASNGTWSSTLTLTSALPRGDNFYGGGFIRSGATQFDIATNTTSTITILHSVGAGPPTQSQIDSFVGHQFEVYDDDDRGSGNTMLELLPQGDVINADVKKAYAAAYIEIEEVPHSAEFNARPTIPFELNSSLVWPWTSLKSSQDLSGADRQEYWYTLLVMAYQYTESLDGDPSTESLELGRTVNHSLIYTNLSSVYVEAVREDALSVAPTGADISALVQRRISRVVAHELGHACGKGPIPDHAEGELMGDDADSEKFAPATILRFRSTSTWQK